MTKDRLIFEKTVLDNGVEIYHQPADVDFFYLKIYVPVGSGHSLVENGGLPGIAHFLEHLTFESSKLYPERNSFEKMIFLDGGYINATTTSRFTFYVVKAHHNDLEKILAGFISQIFEPIFKQESIDIQRGIVTNERMRRRYYPSTSELGQYLSREWMFTERYPLEQVFGSNDDLAKMNPEILAQFHRHYFVKGIKVVIGGKYDIEKVTLALGGLLLPADNIKSKIVPPKWGNKDFHSREFRDINAPTYFVGGLFTDFSIIEYRALDFICDYMTNDGNGPINEWLRKEKGWTYGISYTIDDDIDRLCWRIGIPVNHIDNVPVIQKELLDRVRLALEDKDRVVSEVRRNQKSEIFFFETVGSRVDIFSDYLFQYGEIVTESLYAEFLKTCVDTSLLLDTYNKRMTPEIAGEFLALPKAE